MYMFDRFKDTTSKKTRYGQVAFQVRIKPGSYKIGTETVGAAARSWTIDPHFPNDKLEWSTKRRGVIIPVGILIKVEDTKTK